LKPVADLVETLKKVTETMRVSAAAIAAAAKLLDEFDGSVVVEMSKTPTRTLVLAGTNHDHGLPPESASPAGSRPFSAGSAARVAGGGLADIRLLGPVEVWADDRRVGDLGTPQQRAVLAALAVDAGRPVMLQTLIDRVWDQAPPAGTMPALYAHLSRLRKTLNHTGGLPRGSIGPVRRAGGYTLEVNPDQVDLHRFRKLTVAARDPDRSDEEQAGLLRTALDLWGGPPLADLSGEWAARMREDWAQQQLDTVVAWARVELRRGRHEEVIAPVRKMLAEHPLTEPLTAILMRALIAAGRCAEALDRYSTTRARLIHELGAEPGPDLRALHTAILRGCGVPEVGHMSDLRVRQLRVRTR
jgi:DNA-binding SARP family transcriptional activator